MKDHKHVARAIRRNAFLFLAVFANLSVLGMQNPSAQETVLNENAFNAKLSDAHRAINHREFVKAILVLDEALAMGPTGKNLAMTHFMQGQSFILIKDIAKATNSYLSVVSALAEADLVDDKIFGDLLTAAAGSMGPGGNATALAAISAAAGEAGQKSPDWTMSPKDFSLRLSSPRALLPRNVGKFHRLGFQLLEREWHDVAVHYGTEAGEEGPRVTLYLTYYPVTGVSEHFDNSRKVIGMVARKVKLLEESKAYRPKGRSELSGAYGRFRATMSGQKSATELLIFSINGWHLKLRATYPWKQRKAVGIDVKNFINEFPWPQPVAITLALPDSGKTICAEGPDPGKIYGEIKTLEATLILTLAYAGTDRKTLPSPANAPGAFCLKDRFAVGDRVVDAYWASEPQGDAGVSYRFNIEGGRAFAQVAVSKDLQAILAETNTVDLRADPVHIDYFGENGVSLLGIFDGMPPYALARQIIADAIRDRSLGMAHLKTGDGDQKAEIQLDRNSLQDPESEK